MCSNEVDVSKEVESNNSSKRVSVLVDTYTVPNVPITKEKIYVVCERLYYKSGPNSCLDYFSWETDDEYEFINETIHEWYQNPYICCEWNKRGDKVNVSYPKLGDSCNE
jgi:hypothetical protein|tara:strand:- start:257 stop:583 length:327 start_codon:yes stop_codon:yes gene_type:complete